MATGVKPESRERQSNGNGRRLNSWKEVAAYLDQSVRTLQRWERDEGLPIHRSAGKKRGTIFAYEEELNAWFVRREGEGGLEPKSSLRRPLLLWAAAAIVAATLAGAAFLTETGEVQPPLASERHVASTSARFGAISPDGRRLAAVDRNDDYLYVSELPGGSARRRVANDVLAVAWSPDSSRLAYTSGREGAHHLKLLDVDSGKSRTLRTDSSSDGLLVPLRWADAGDALFCRSVDWDRLGLVSLDGATLRELEAPDGPVPDAALSADGRVLAYMRRDGRFGDIHTVGLAGNKEPVQITSFDEFERHPFWGPDDKTLLFARRYGMTTAAKTEIWAVSFDANRGGPTGDPYRVAAPDDLFPSIPPVLTGNGDLLWARRESPYRALVLEVDPVSGEQLGEPTTNFQSGTQAKRWSKTEPVLYYWDASMRWQLLTDALVVRGRNFDTGREELRHIPWPDLEYAWFSYNRAHSKGVFGVHKPGGGSTTLLYDVATDKTTTLADSDEILGFGQLSNDDNQVALVERGAPGAQAHSVRVVDIETKSVHAIFQGAISSRPEWSPNDAEIAFVDGRCLTVADVRSAEAEAILCSPEPVGDAQKAVPSPLPGISGTAVWSPDGEKLAWPVVNWPAGKVELWIVD